METLMEVWEVTEYRDGCVYKTRNTGERRWIPMGEKPPKGFKYVVISDPSVQTMRMSK